MQSIAPETAAVDDRQPKPQITAADRCDSCGSQAYVRVEIANGELFFCAHHGRKHHEKLAGIAKSWHDESDRLLDEPRS